MSRISLSASFVRNALSAISNNPLLLYLSIAILFSQLIVVGCNPVLEKNSDKNKGNNQVELRYIDSINLERSQKLIEFIDTTTSRFTQQEIDSFQGFNYFKPDIMYRVAAQFVVDTTIPVFGMKTNTSRTPTYRTYGYLNFEINDTTYRLSAFQNMHYKDHPEYGGSLFVPFTDKTNKSSTYKAGRYIDISIPDSNHVILDFNGAYNPYCAYYNRWSCPLVPYENHIDISIQAGEKKYK